MLLFDPCVKMLLCNLNNLRHYNCYAHTLLGRCTLPSITKRHIVIARLKQPANLGRTSQEVKFIILVVVPVKLVSGLAGQGYNPGQALKTLNCP